MFRKLMLTAALALGAFAALETTPASANPPLGHNQGRGHRNARFEVLVRHGNHWDSHGAYRDRDDAERVAHHLRHRGFQVRIDRDR